MEPPELKPSFQQLAQQLSPSLLGYLRRYVGDRAVADDLLQESLIRIARGLPGFEGNSSIKTWAFAIATHVAADYFRAPERRARVVDIDEASAIVDPDRPIDERIVIDEMNHCVRQVIESLPDDYRAALVLHDLEGLSAQDTATVTECSLATAKMRIHRARLRLREALNQQCDFYRDAEDVFRCAPKALP